jgi:lysophospholipase L1-like esterase
MGCCSTQDTYRDYVKKTAPHRLLGMVVVIVLLLTQLAAPVVAAPAQWQYTALGDSLATGVLPLVLKGYVPRYKDHIQADASASVSLNNLGQNGWMSRDLLNALRTDESFRSSVRSSSVVTWNIGGNDLRAARKSYKDRICGGADNQDCLRNTRDTFKANWAAIIVEILALRSTSNTIIRTMDIYNPHVSRDKATDTWPNDGGNDLEVFKPYLDEINSYIAETAAAHNIPFAQVYLAFNGSNGEEDPNDKGYIAADGLHPNGKGHQEIAERLRGLGYAPLTSRDIRTRTLGTIGA